MSVTVANVHHVTVTTSGTIHVVESSGVKTTLSPTTSAADLTTVLSVITTHTNSAVRKEAHDALKLLGYSGQLSEFH